MEPLTFQPLNLCDIEQVVSICVSKEDALSQKVEIHTTNSPTNDADDEENSPTISLSLEDRDAEELLLVLAGYFKLLTRGRDLEIVVEKSPFEQEQGKLAN